MKRVRKYNIFKSNVKQNGFCNAVYTALQLTPHNNSNIDDKTILIFDNEEHMSFVRWVMRYNYDPNTKYAVRLSEGLCICTDIMSAFVNMRVFQILKSYEVSGGDISSVVFEYSYMKGEPEKYISKVAKYLFSIDIKDMSTFISYILSEIKEVFYDMSIIVNGIQSLEHSLFGYIDGYNKYLWFKNALDKPVITKEDTPFEINRKIELIKDNLKASQIHPLSDLMTMGVKNNPAQSAAFLCYGFTPNWNDINHCKSVIQGGYLNGFRRIEDFYLNDNNGRIATIKGKADVKEPGVLGKEITQGVSSERINTADKREVVKDCKSRLYFPITIKSESDLKYFRFKYYYDTTNHKRLGWVDADRTDLIGKTLYIRTIMTCACKNHICEECFGYNAKICQDTPIQKFDAYTYVAAFVSQKMQGVISVKHHLAAKLAPMKVSYGDIRDMDLEDFLKKSKIITKMEFDILHINKKCKVRFENYDVNTYKNIPTYEASAFPQFDAGKYGKLYIDDMEFETIEAIKKIDDYTYQITIPNTSVISDADDLIEALRTHGEEVFNQDKAFAGKSITEQLQIVYEFIKQRLPLPSFIYYEILTHSLTVDYYDRASKVSTDTQKLAFITSRSIANKSKKTYIHPNISEGIVHGFLEKAITNVMMQTNPTPFDIAYGHIHDRDATFYNIPQKLDEIIVDVFPEMLNKEN